MDGCAVAMRARVLATSSGATVADLGTFVEVPSLGPDVVWGSAETTATRIDLPGPGPYTLVVAAEDATGRNAVARQTILSEAWGW
jgi:hypothetical protein